MAAPPPQINQPICNFTVAPPGVEIPRRGRCLACQSRSASYVRCRGLSATQGCVDCADAGIPCIRGDFALPPNPGRRTGPIVYPAWTACSRCANFDECDRGHPCQRCIDKGQAAACEREALWRGLLYRPIPGDNMYGYWIMQKQGKGPNGHEDRDLTGEWAFWRMPDNYHIEFALMKYWEYGWLDHWHGPRELTWGTPELPAQLGPIYIGPPAGFPTPAPITYFRPNCAPLPAALSARGGTERTPMEELAVRLGWPVPDRSERTPADEIADRLSWSLGTQPPQPLPTTPAPLTRFGAVRRAPSVPPPAVGPRAGQPAWGPLGPGFGAFEEWQPPIDPAIQGSGPSAAKDKGKRVRFGDEQGDEDDPEDGNGGKRTKVNDKEAEDQAPKAPPKWRPTGGKAPIWGNKAGKKPYFGGKGPVWPGTLSTPQPPVEQVDTQDYQTAIGDTGFVFFQDDMEIDDVVGGAHFGASSPLPEKSPSPPRGSRIGSPEPPRNEDPFRDPSAPLVPNLRDFLDQTLNQAGPSSAVKSPPPQVLDAHGNLSPLSQLLHGGLEAQGQPTPAVQNSDKLPVPPVRPPPAPQTLPGWAPQTADELIASNEAMFGPHTAYVRRRWSYYPLQARVQTHSVASAAWIQYIMEQLNPNGMPVARADRPVARPPSPGPYTPIFVTDPSAIPADHPFKEDMGRGPMPNIHRQRAWKVGAIAEPPGRVCSSCENFTQGICESDEHHPSHRCYVCSDCDTRGRENVRALMQEFNFINSSKRYACRACTAGLLHNPSFTNGSGIDIYDARLSEDASPDTVGYDPRCYTQDHHPNEGLVIRGGVHPRHVYTGCPCAEKLLFRRLCNGHRSQAFFDSLNRLYKMAAYKWGRIDAQVDSDVCFACMKNPPQMPGDMTNQDEAGRVWACLMCSGVCVGDCPANLSVMSDEVPLLPFGDAPEGKKVRILAPPSREGSSEEEEDAGNQNREYSSDSNNGDNTKGDDDNDDSGDADSSGDGNGDKANNADNTDADGDEQMGGTSYDEQDDPLGIYN
ncbi:hypothetical protein PFICI_04971 [Pestalotiopsis fici W106-1]|uniref:Uncharacterized protein n=1 Tax=Pestalotiopsis fici (strain W106-1 / CGMCC3.15140) TaxID=1229662 RepID=W3XAL6_PESFW|nr:uncharacterized protein PFICI_04971 [Pestalotiopsis fici W106-1]ETS83095.1 hypothetical protein PFICI_04971 [Pestalotiopsis fici W106-1]